MTCTMLHRLAIARRAAVSVLVVALLTPAATARAQTPWTVVLSSTPATVAMGSCSAISLSVTDAGGREPRNRLGTRVSMADFDLRATGAVAGTVVGNRNGGNVFSACACQSATVGAIATVTATYPAASIVEKDLQIPGVEATSTTTIPIIKAFGTSDAVGCGKTTTVSLVTAPAAVSVAVSSMTLTAAAPASTAVAAASTTAGPAIGVEDGRAPAPMPAIGWRGRLTLDGETTDVGLLRGGTSAASVITMGSGLTATKQLGALRVEPIIISTWPSPKLVAWIGSVWAGGTTRKSGSVQAQWGGARASATQAAQLASEGGKLAFANARLLSTRIPTLGAARDSATGMSIGMMRPAPLVVTLDASAISKAGATTGSLVTESSITGFQLKVSGLEFVGVRGVESFVVGLPDVSSTGGNIVPNIFVTITESQSPAWVAWYRDFAINGNNGAAQEKTFTLALTSNNGTLVTIKGAGVGIAALRAVGLGALEAELYVERLDMVAGAVP